MWGVLSLVVVVALLAVLALVWLRGVLVDKGGQSLAFLAQASAQKLDRLLFERQADLKILSRSLEPWFDDPARLNSYMRLVKKEYGTYEWIGVLDRNGRIIVGTNDEWDGQDRSGQAWFTMGAHQKEVLVLAPASYPETRGQDAIAFIAPLGGKEPRGVLVAFVTLSLLADAAFQKTAFTGPFQPTTDVQYRILDRDGTILFDSLVNDHFSEQGRAKLPDPLLPKGYTVERDENGREMVGGYARTQEGTLVPGVAWVISARLPKEEILAPLLVVARLIGVASVSLILPLVILLVWSLRRLAKGAVKLHASEEQLRQAHSELERRVEERTKEVRDKQQQLIQTAKLASLGELAAGVAHELNNPLNNILLFVGNAIDKVKVGMAGRALAGPLTGDLKAATEQIDRAAAIIQQLRRFARLSGTTFEAIHINEVVHSSVLLLGQQLRLKNVELEVRLCPRDPIVHGNRVQLEQVLINLLSNASDAVEQAVVKRITIESGCHNDEHRIRVADTGGGIRKEDLPRIFDPFFTTKEVGVGTGLGLSIVYGILKDHGGRITVSTEPGKGSTFEVHLPLRQPIELSKDPVAHN
ncbi:sensor histidine kinase [Candidatus Nitrospira bockiana]